jgi:hypothetical protein
MENTKRPFAHQERALVTSVEIKQLPVYGIDAGVEQGCGKIGRSNFMHDQVDFLHDGNGRAVTL